MVGTTFTPRFMFSVMGLAYLTFLVRLQPGADTASRHETDPKLNE